MQEISELEGRITAALERIGKGVDRLAAAVLSPGAAAPDPDPALMAELAEQKSLVARLQDRLQGAQAPTSQDDLLGRVDRLTQKLHRMRNVNAALREHLAALRSAQATGVTDPQLINQSLVVELDALRAERLSELAEMEEILAALEPHLTEVGHA